MSHPPSPANSRLPDGRKAMPAFALLAERFLADDYAPESVAPRCGVDAGTIRRIARELADAAFDQAIRLPQHWTDCHGREHDEMIGRPVSMHAMRGISAHANGFHTCRTIHVLQMLLGAIDTPGSFRYQPPYPKAVPPANRPGRTRTRQRRARRRTARLRARARKTSSSTRMVRRAASTRRSRGNSRSPRTACCNP